MKRFGLTQFGGPEVLHELDATIPTPKPNQALLKVLGFGLNPYDARLRAGAFVDSRPLQFPIVPGTDVVGQIVALGTDVEDFAIGDIVMNYRPIGGYSEYVTASATKLFEKPSAMSLVTAAALPQVGIAAYSLLAGLVRTDGDHLTILGAGGGVGTILVQLALYEGYTVTAVASARHHEALAALGVATIATYQEASHLPAAPIVIDCVAGGDPALEAAMLAPGGRLLSLNPTTGEQLASFAPVQAAFNALATTAHTRGLTLPIQQQLPFSQAGVQTGHRLLQARTTGKLVVLR